VPSSMIFASLVVLWLLILVPAVARHRQEVARPSLAALSGRVLERSRQRPGPAAGRELEVDAMDEVGQADTRGRGDDGDEQEWADEAPDDRRWERPPPRYRPGRGGFDPEAAALAARARYAFRQRVVLAMLIAALVTGVLAAVAVPGLWLPHAAVDVALVGYLVYLRRQVRMEEAIRERRASRMAGTRRTAAADDPELDDWARRGRDETTFQQRDDADGVAEPGDPADGRDDEPADDLVEEQPERVRGTGEPLRPARVEESDGSRRDRSDAEPALPRLLPAPPPALPAGTALVEVDEDDPELYELECPARPDYRRAAGQ
jgi:hypothetical protein